MDEIEELKQELEKVKGFLRESRKENNALLESRVSSTVYTVAKAFAEAAKTVKQDCGIVPTWQINATMQQRLEYAGIIQMQKIGDIVEYNPEIMVRLDASQPQKEKVEIVYPSCKIVINGNDYILTSASVKNVEHERRQLTGGVCDPPPAG